MTGLIDRIFKQQSYDSELSSSEERESEVFFGQNREDDSIEVVDFDLNSILNPSKNEDEKESIFEDYYKPKVLEGKILVTRSPCHFPSDLQGFNAVDNC